MPTIGLVGTGQSPRPDIMPGIREILGPDFKILERGALDGMVRSHIDELGRDEGDHRLLTRISDGSFVIVGTRQITPLIQDAIDQVVAEGAELVGLLFTWELQELHAPVPLIQPHSMLKGLVDSCLPNGRLGVIVPLSSDEASANEFWRTDKRSVFAAAAVPYGDPRDIERVAYLLKVQKVDMVVMDSMGYTRALRQQVADITGKRVVLPKTILARTILEILA